MLWLNSLLIITNPEKSCSDLINYLRPRFSNMPKLKTKTGLGGRRKGAGRKPIADKKVAITLYVPQSVVQSHGGLEDFREYCYQLLASENEGK